MRKFLISAALVSAAAVATPAAAQWGYPQTYNNGFGYNRGVVQGIQNQVRQMHQQIERMYQRRLLSDRERNSLHERAENINRRLFDYSRNGLSQREYFDLQNRLQELRVRIQRERLEGREDRRERDWDRRDRRDRDWDRRDRRDRRDRDRWD